MALSILISLFLMLLSCLVIWKAASGFETASDFLGRNLSQGVKGATINAIASSMPELLSSFFFLFYLKDVNGFSGGLGITAGSSIFNLLIIPAAVIIVVLIKNPEAVITISGTVLKRDGLVLIITIFILVIVLDRKALTAVHGLTLVMAYLLYLAYLYFSMRSGEKNTIQDFRRKPADEKTGKWNLLFRLDLENFLLGRKSLNTLNAWMLLLLSTFIMSLGTWMLVVGTEKLSHSLDIPILFVAVILSAAASSVPDTVISIKDAKKKNYDDAISNALGSNIFDISFALGLPLFIYTLINGEIRMEQSVIDLSTELWMFLFVTTVLAYIIFISGKRLTLVKAILFLSIYAVFVFYVVGEAARFPLIESISGHLTDFFEWIKKSVLF